jgi:type VI secretion system protein ImpH
MSSLTRLPLREELLADPEGFAFTQVIDLLEQIAPPRRRMGQGSDPGAEAVWLTSEFGLAFRTGPIAALKDGPIGGAAHELAVNFFGLGCAQGPLPEPYVELIVEQHRRKAHAGAAFLAIFQHRLLSFVYRSENEFRIAAPFRRQQDGCFMPALRALLGLPAGGAPAALATILMAHAPLVVQQRRSISGFLELLRSHFGVPVGGAEFTGRWISLPDELQTVLGEHGRNDLLGQGTVLGQRAWDQNGAVEVRFGALPMERFAAMLPGGAAHAEMSAICAYYLGSQIHCYAWLELDAVPSELSVGGDDGAAADDPYALGRDGFRLGFSSWLRADAEPEPLAQRQLMLVFNDGEHNDCEQ